jgi:hypothetical protein
MNKKACITSTQAVGCTFVDWSIHFLSGQTHYYNYELDQHIKLSENPVNKINSHGHDKNHPSGANELKVVLDHFDKILKNTMCSAYPVPMHFDVAASHLNIPIDQINIPQYLEEIKNYILEDYNKFFNICEETNTKLVFVSSDPATIFYHQTVRSLDRFMTKPTKPNSVDDAFNEIQETFFKSSTQTWADLQLNNRWDLRERLALDSRPMHTLFDDKNFDFYRPHLWINCQELWVNPIKTIKKIMDYLELTIDSNRYKSWIPICRTWQQIQVDILNFCYTHKHIVESVINNWDYKIDLTFHQEVIVQHFLIYKYNLNLKTWNLDKFPDNTKKLHQLLETNIHVVPKIY